MASNIRPKWTIIVDPDIDVHSSTDVEWAMAFRVQPQRDVIIVDNVPADVGPLGRPHPRTHHAHRLDDRHRRHRPFGEPFYDVADVPGWEDFDMPELEK